MPTFIAMNRFKVLKDKTQSFEQAWLGRTSRLDEVPGFVEFRLLKGPEHEDYILYASHTLWASKECFVAWTQSEQFRAAHAQAGDEKPKTLGHPEFEGFEAIQTLRNANPQTG